PNVASITANLGASFIIDNFAAVLNDRVRNVASITLAGGTLEFRGNPSAPVNEIVGALQTNSNFTSSIITVSQGQPITLSANSLTRLANSYMPFRGYGQDLGSANNQLLFFAPATPLLANGILPF